MNECKQRKTKYNYDIEYVNERLRECPKLSLGKIADEKQWERKAFIAWLRRNFIESYSPKYNV